MPIEISGDDDEVGADDIDDIVGDDDEIGARARRKKKKAVRSVGYGKTMYQVMGVTSSATIAAAASSNVTANPQIPFKPVRIVMRASSSWDLTDIKCGNRSQFVATGTVPGDVFAATSVDVLLDLETVQAMQNFVLAVTNNTAGALTHSSGVLGPSALT